MMYALNFLSRLPEQVLESSRCVQEPGGRLFRASSDPNLRKEGTVRLEPGDPGHGPAQPYGVRPQVNQLTGSYSLRPALKVII